MNKLANDKGITLLALVITIIILIILAAIAIPAGRDTIEKAKLTTFETEIQTMQYKVNELAQKLDSKDQNSVSQIQSLGNSIQQVQEQATKAFEGADVYDTTGYKYYSKEVLENLGFPNFKNEFLVNVEKRSVIGLTGAKYKGLAFYTVDQLQNDLYNVDYAGVNSQTTFDLSAEENKLIINNIRYLGDVKKGTIYYGKGDNENSVDWKIAKTNTTDTSCDIEVKEEATWYVKIVDSADNTSQVKSISTRLIKIVITSNTQDVNVEIGGSATFSVTVDDESNVTYQWYKNNNNSANGGTAIKGATSKSYTIQQATADMNNTYYYCVITKKVGNITKSVTSNVAKLTV